MDTSAKADRQGQAGLKYMRCRDMSWSRAYVEDLETWEYVVAKFPDIYLVGHLWPPLRDMQSQIFTRNNVYPWVRISNS